MDACRAEEHAPVGTPLPPKPAHRSSARGSNTLSREKNQKECLSRGSADGCAPTSPRPGRPTATQPRCRRTTAAASARRPPAAGRRRSEEHTSELQSLMRISYAVFCLKKKTTQHTTIMNTSDRKTGISATTQQLNMSRQK